jgi:hydrogenase expression/formation protein HypE
VIIISGTIGDHGMAVMSKREGLGFETDILSDSAPLNYLVADILAVCPEVHAFRDPTRGGVTSTLIEFAEGSGVGIVIDEKTLPVTDSVRGACEILGLDPLFVANEGKLIVSVPADRAEAVLEVMKKNRYGTDSVVIGRVVSDHPGRVLMKTLIGGTRIIDMLSGEQLPRIC